MYVHVAAYCRLRLGKSQGVDFLFENDAPRGIARQRWPSEVR